ncbi:MAG: hypothetical protein ACD_40C00299G0002 [uncultured bacterium]|nr:MAG: hypothetical protein ACD_40C00299G0002 [uncultured bacterium]
MPVSHLPAPACDNLLPLDAKVFSIGLTTLLYSNTPGLSVQQFLYTHIPAQKIIQRRIIQVVNFHA